jgi:hypothetical protein
MDTQFDTHVHYTVLRKYTSYLLALSLKGGLEVPPLNLLLLLDQLQLGLVRLLHAAQLVLLPLHLYIWVHINRYKDKCVLQVMKDNAWPHASLPRCGDGAAASPPVIRVFIRVTLVSGGVLLCLRNQRLLCTYRST